MDDQNLGFLLKLGDQGLGQVAKNVCDANGLVVKTQGEFLRLNASCQCKSNDRHRHRLALQICLGFSLIGLLLLLQQIVEVCGAQFGNVADAMTLLCQPFEQCCL